MTAQIKMTRKEAEVQMACFRQTFSSVRLLNEKDRSARTAGAFQAHRT